MIGSSTASKVEGGLPLPTLRAELELLPGAADANGRPVWLIHDPLMNRFTQIEPAAREALKHWRSCSTAEELVQRVNADGLLQIDLQAVKGLIDFLYASQLTERPRADDWRSFAKAHEARKHSLPAWLIHNYLFFRITIVRPQALLEQTLPTVQVLWSRTAQLAILAMGLIGLYLASRQWEHFLGTLMSYFSWEGLLTGAVTLGLVKIAHELGHAYAAVKFGCRVHSMGLAFVVMAPMPYTDVTDAWRLTDRRKRLLIDSAGMITEGGIAAVALFVWAFLPDGSLRSAFFVLSAVSIISSLAINLNPFMRFDGYYLFSEIIGVPNLQSRAFAFGRWKMRELLFGLGAPCPEDLSPQRATVLVIYAWVTWIYRLFLFVGIALLVYHYFFKVLGIILFAVEIVFFIARPVSSELLVWWRLRQQILGSRRTKLTLAGGSIAILAFLLPWSATVEIPAVLESERLQAMYPARNARVVSVDVKHGETVKTGDTIVTLSSSDIEEELARARISLRIAEVQYGRRIADASDRESSLVLESTLESLRAKIAGLLKEQKELTIVSPFDGRIADLNPELQAGRWVSPRDMIAIISGGDSLVAKGYVAEADVARIEPGAVARFIPEHPSRSYIDLRVVRIATAGATQIEIADLASTHMGRISVNVDDKHRLVPTSAHYLVTMAAPGAAKEMDLSIRGVVHAEGRAESLLSRTWRRALGILVRESGA